jgi:hypothetical protein
MYGRWKEKERWVSEEKEKYKREEAAVKRKEMEWGKDEIKKKP